ncbi:MAG: phage major capsid protein [Christensenellales bacterium]
MNLDDMNLQQVEERLAALDNETRSFSKPEQFDAASEEKKQLLTRQKELQDLAKRSQDAAKINEGKAPDAKVFETRKVDKKMDELHIGNMTREEALALPEYRTGWLKGLMAKPMNEVEKRVWDLVTIQSAAAAVPTIVADEIVDNMVKIAPMLNEITLFRVPGVLRMMVEGVRANAALHVENAPIVAAVDTLTAVTLSQFEFVKTHEISATIRNTAVGAFEAWLVKALAEDIAEALETGIILGTSVTGGIENVVAPWVDNVNGIDYGAGLVYDDIVDLIALLPARHDKNAKFLMNKAMFYNQFAKVLDANGFPIVAKEFASPIPYRILGFPVIISDTVGAGNAYFGNFKRLYGNMSQEINVKASEEATFANNSVLYRGSVIFDCDHPDATAWRKLFT